MLITLNPGTNNFFEESRIPSSLGAKPLLLHYVGVMYNAGGFYKLYFWLGKDVALFNIKAVVFAHISETLPQPGIKDQSGDSMQPILHQKERVLYGIIRACM